MECGTHIDIGSTRFSAVQRRETPSDAHHPTVVENGSSAIRCSKCSKDVRGVLEEALVALDAGRLDLAREELQRLLQALREHT